jgi:ABC-type transport system substrate-binding protein
VQIAYALEPDAVKQLESQGFVIDPAKREQLLQQAAKIIHDDVAIVPLYNAINPLGINKKVEGFKVLLDGMALFENLAVPG